MEENDEMMQVKSGRLNMHKYAPSALIETAKYPAEASMTIESQSQAKIDDTSTVGGSSRFGRRYRKSEAPQNAGPIKIKKIIQQKEQQA